MLEQIKDSKDAELINTVAHLYLGTDELPAINVRGWEATGDQRFAASLLLSLAEKKELKPDDERLAKGVKEFPENEVIAAIVLRLAIQEKSPQRDALINAIKAEYSHFSLNANPLFPRPGADVLRVYFLMLSKAPQPKAAEPTGEAQT